MTGIRGRPAKFYKAEDYVYPEQVSWGQIFSDLKQNDVRPGQIAELIGVPQSSLQRLMGGVEPRHSIGQSLLELHSRYCST